MGTECTVGFTIKKDIVALVQKHTYVDHYLSCRRFGEEPPRWHLTRPPFFRLSHNHKYYHHDEICHTMNIIGDTPKPLAFTLRKSRHPLSLTWASRRYPSLIFVILFDHGCYFRNPCYGFSGQIPFIFTIASISPLIGRFSTQKLGTRPIISQSARLTKVFFRFRLQAH